MLLKSTLLLLSAWTLTTTAAVVYDSIPTPLPPNVASAGFEATSTAELGNAVTLAPGNRHLDTITVVMSDWAKRSDWLTTGTDAGYTVPLTMNLYNVGAGSAVGTKFATLTVNAFIPWRPEHDAACGNNQSYLASDGNCYNGLATEIVFDFLNQNLLLPDSLIFGLAFNTEHHGYSPTGVPGPYASLNFGTDGSPIVGSNIYPDSAYLNSTDPSMYADGGAAGTGVFRLDTNGWPGYSPEIRIEVIPEPTTAALMLAAFGLALLQKLLSAARVTRSSSE